MLAATTPAVRDVGRIRARALAVAGGAAAAAVAWSIEVPLLGVRLAVKFGPMHPETVVAGQIIGAALVTGLLGWLLLALLERATPGILPFSARTAWTGAALLVLVLSLGLPVAAATTTAAAVGLVVLHLVVAAAVIPVLAATARPASR